jgi:hypothetical protein
MLTGVILQQPVKNSSHVDIVKRNTQRCCFSRSKYFMSCCKKAVVEIKADHVYVLSPECRSNHDIKTCSTSFGKVAAFKYSGMTTVTHQNYIHEGVNNMIIISQKMIIIIVTAVETSNLTELITV